LHPLKLRFRLLCILRYTVCNGRQNPLPCQGIGVREHSASVCLGITKSLEGCCVLKLYDSSKGEHTAAVTTALSVALEIFLVMPYMFPLSKDKRHHYLQKGAIARALRFRHMNIKWRHIGCNQAERTTELTPGPSEHRVSTRLVQEFTHDWNQRWESPIQL
jgi:hypothetical protein